MHYEYQTTLHETCEDFPPHLSGWEFQGWHILDGETAVDGVRKVTATGAVHFSASRNAPAISRPVKRAHWRRSRA